MKTIKKDIERTGSDTFLRISVNDAINVKARIKERLPNLHWSIMKTCFAIKHKYGVSYAIPNVISGDL